MFGWRCLLQIGGVSCSVPMFHCARFEVGKKVTMVTRTAGANISDLSTVALKEKWKVEIVGYRQPSNEVNHRATPLVRPNDPFVALEMVRSDNKDEWRGEMIVEMNVSGGGAMEVEIDSRRYCATAFEIWSTYLRRAQFLDLREFWLQWTK